MLDPVKHVDREANYRHMVLAVQSLVADERNVIAILSNVSAIVYFYMDTINWSGFYITESSSGDLVLGPFQGLPACVRIAPGKGVCGTAASRRETVVVPDVHAFPGHIACDGNSRSEIVLPIFRPDGSVFGVLDIDSPVTDRFAEAECAALTEVARLVEQAVAK